MFLEVWISMCPAFFVSSALHVDAVAHNSPCSRRLGQGREGTCATADLIWANTNISSHCKIATILKYAMAGYGGKGWSLPVIPQACRPAVAEVALHHLISVKRFRHEDRSSHPPVSDWPGSASRHRHRQWVCWDQQQSFRFHGR